MTFFQYCTAVTEAADYADREGYISYFSRCDIWGDPEDDPVPADRLRQLSDIWEATHRSVRDIAAAAGLSHRKLAERFAIPHRTMENWCGEQRECPLYTRLLMQESLGLLSLDL